MVRAQGQRSEQPLLSQKQMFIERMVDDIVLCRKILNTINGRGRLGDF